MHGTAVIGNGMQRKCVALVAIGSFGLAYPYTSLHRNQSARLVQAQVKTSNLEHVVRCWLACNFVSNFCNLLDKIRSWNWLYVNLKSSVETMLY